MYISQFWCGVIATVIFQFAVIIIYATFRKDKDNDK